MVHNIVNEIRCYAKLYGDGSMLYCASEHIYQDRRRWELKSLEEVALRVKKFNGNSRFILVNGPDSGAALTCKWDCKDFELKPLSEEDAAKFLEFFDEGIKKD